MEGLVRGLYSCTDMELFPQLWQTTKLSLVANAEPGLVTYVEYFQKQWINSRNKQGGAMRAGISITNNPIESHNREIKRTYLRGKVMLAELMQGLYDYTNHESHFLKPAALEPPPMLFYGLFYITYL